MAAFNEWWEEAREALAGFTDKGVAHFAWDAAIKSLEGVQTQTTNCQSAPCPVCSTALRLDANFCMQCGRRVQDEAHV
jgi:hypothetical protein